VFRTGGDHISLWEATLPAELLVLTDKLARVDRLLDDPTFLAPLRIVEGGQLALL
jgi:IS5 family transposase